MWWLYHERYKMSTIHLCKVHIQQSLSILCFFMGEFSDKISHWYFIFNNWSPNKVWDFWDNNVLSNHSTILSMNDDWSLIAIMFVSTSDMTIITSCLLLLSNIWSMCTIFFLAFYHFYPLSLYTMLSWSSALIFYRS